MSDSLPQTGLPAIKVFTCEVPVPRRLERRGLCGIATGEVFCCHRRDFLLAQREVRDVKGGSCIDIKHGVG